MNTKINEEIKVLIRREKRFNISINRISKIEGRSFLLLPGSKKLHVGDIVSDEALDNDLNIYDVTVELELKEN